METLCPYVRLIWQFMSFCPIWFHLHIARSTPEPGEEQPRISTSLLPLSLLETEIECQSQCHKLGTRSPECVFLGVSFTLASLRPSGRDPCYSQLWRISCTLGDLPDQMLFDWHWQLRDWMNGCHTEPLRRQWGTVSRSNIQGTLTSQ